MKSDSRHLVVEQSSNLLATGQLCEQPVATVWAGLGSQTCMTRSSKVAAECLRCQEFLQILPACQETPAAQGESGSPGLPQEAPFRGRIAHSTCVGYRLLASPEGKWNYAECG